MLDLQKNSLLDLESRQLSLDPFLPEETERDHQFKLAFEAKWIDLTGRLRPEKSSLQNLEEISSLFINRLNTLLEKSIFINSRKIYVIEILERLKLYKRIIEKFEIVGTATRRIIPIQDIKKYLDVLGIAAFCTDFAMSKWLEKPSDIDLRIQLIQTPLQSKEERNRAIDAVSVEVLRYLAIQSRTPFSIQDTLQDLLKKLNLKDIYSDGDYRLITIDGYDIAIGYNKNYYLFTDTNLHIVLKPKESNVGTSESENNFTVNWDIFLESQEVNTAASYVSLGLDLIDDAHPEEKDYRVCMRYHRYLLKGKACQRTEIYQFYVESFLKKFFHSNFSAKHIAEFIERIIPEQSIGFWLARYLAFLQFELWLRKTTDLAQQVSDAQLDSVWRELARLGSLQNTFHPLLDLRIFYNQPVAVIGAALFCAAVLPLALPGEKRFNQDKEWEVYLTRHHNLPMLDCKFPSGNSKQKFYTFFIEFSPAQWSRYIEEQYRTSGSSLTDSSPEIERFLALFSQFLIFPELGSQEISIVERYKIYLETDIEEILGRAKVFLNSTNSFLAAAGVSLTTLLIALGSSQAKKILFQKMPQLLRHGNSQLRQISYLVAARLLAFISPSYNCDGILDQLTKCEQNSLSFNSSWLFALAHTKDPYLCYLGIKYWKKHAHLLGKAPLNTISPEAISAYTALLLCCQKAYLYQPEKVAKICRSSNAPVIWEKTGFLEESLVTLLLPLTEALFQPAESSQKNSLNFLRDAMLSFIPFESLSFLQKIRLSVLVDSTQNQKVQSKYQKAIASWQAEWSLNPKLWLQRAQKYLSEQQFRSVPSLLEDTEYLEAADKEKIEFVDKVVELFTYWMQNANSSQMVTKTFFKICNTIQIDHERYQVIFNVYVDRYRPQAFLLKEQIALTKKILKKNKSLSTSTYTFLLDLLDKLVIQSPLLIHVCYELLSALFHIAELKLSLHQQERLAGYLLIWIKEAIEDDFYSLQQISTWVLHPAVKSQWKNQPETNALFLTLLYRLKQKAETFPQVLGLLSLLVFWNSTGNNYYDFRNLIEELIKLEGSKQLTHSKYLTSLKDIYIQQTLIKIHYEITNSLETFYSSHQLLLKLFQLSSRSKNQYVQILKETALELLKNKKGIEEASHWLLADESISLLSTTWIECCSIYLKQSLERDTLTQLVAKIFSPQTLSIFKQEKAYHAFIQSMFQNKKIKLHWSYLKQVAVHSLAPVSIWMSVVLRQVQYWIDQKEYQKAAKSLLELPFYEEISAIEQQVMNELIQKIGQKELSLVLQLIQKGDYPLKTEDWYKLWEEISYNSSKQIITLAFNLSKKKFLHENFQSEISSKEVVTACLMLEIIYRNTPHLLEHFICYPSLLQQALTERSYLKEHKALFSRDIILVFMRQNSPPSKEIFMAFYHLQIDQNNVFEKRLSIDAFILKHYFDLEFFKKFIKKTKREILYTENRLINLEKFVQELFDIFRINEKIMSLSTQDKFIYFLYQSLSNFSKINITFCHSLMDWILDKSADVNAQKHLLNIILFLNLVLNLSLDSRIKIKEQYLKKILLLLNEKINLLQPVDISTLDLLSNLLTSLDCINKNRKVSSSSEINELWLNLFLEQFSLSEKLKDIFYFNKTLTLFINLHASKWKDQNKSLLIAYTAIYAMTTIFSDCKDLDFLVKNYQRLENIYEKQAFRDVLAKDCFLLLLSVEVSRKQESEYLPSPFFLTLGIRCFSRKLTDAWTLEQKSLADKALCSLFIKICAAQEYWPESHYHYFMKMIRLAMKQGFLQTNPELDYIQMCLNYSEKKFNPAHQVPVERFFEFIRWLMENYKDYIDAGGNLLYPFIKQLVSIEEKIACFRVIIDQMKIHNHEIFWRGALPRLLIKLNNSVIEDLYGRDYVGKDKLAIAEIHRDLIEILIENMKIHYNQDMIKKEQLFNFLNHYVRTFIEVDFFEFTNCQKSALDPEFWRVFYQIASSIIQVKFYIIRGSEIDAIKRKQFLESEALSILRYYLVYEKTYADKQGLASHQLPCSIYQDSLREMAEQTDEESRNIFPTIAAQVIKDCPKILTALVWNNKALRTNLFVEKIIWTVDILK